MTLIEKELILFKDTFFYLIVYKSRSIAPYSWTVNKNSYLAPAIFILLSFQYWTTFIFKL